MHGTNAIKTQIIQFITFLWAGLHVSGVDNPSSGTRTAVITASGTGQPGLLPTAQQRERMVVDPVNQYQNL